MVDEDDADEDDAFTKLLRSVARTPDIAELRRDIGPGAELLGRFVIGRQLGEGGMGKVFAAFDRQRQVKVAIKTLGVLTPHSVVALKSEFRSVAELNHPNLVRLHELFDDADDWFFSMELLEGATLRQLLREHPGDSELVVHVFRQLALALSELHAAGIRHGDLKPSNFVVVGAERRVVLLDFGVSRPLEPDARPAPYAGTREYSAPEQLAGTQVTEAADWYAFGVVLFEALTGTLPSRSAPLHELERAPPELSALCRQLLRHAPEERATGEVVRRVLGASGSRAPSPSWRRATTPPQLFGRHAELEQLFLAHARSATDGPQVVLVRGESGIGKTALVEHFARTAARRGAVVLSARCRERESTSYKAVDGIIDDLVRYLDQLPQAEAASLLPEGLEELTRLFPALRTAAVVHARASSNLRDSTPDQSLVKQRAVGAFRDLLAAVGARAPLVLCVDDLQWSDLHSASLLQPLLAGPKPAPLLLVGISRSLGELHGPTLDALYGQGKALLPRAELIELGPLSPSDAESFASDLLPNNDGRSQLAQSIAREARGSPLFIAELVHDAAFGPVGAASPTGAHSLAQLVAHRLEALPADARIILELTALAGVPLSRSAARRSSDLTPNRTEEAIDLLRASHLTRSHDAAEERSIETRHDRIRELVLQSLPADVEREHHLRLAQAFLAERTVQPEVIAGHYEAAGDARAAGRFWVKAADVAFDALSFAHAADLYGRGEALAELTPPQLAALRVRKADALALAGKAVAAADQYLLAADEHGQDQAIELRRRAAEQLLLSGHLDRGLEVIAQVLRDLGMRRTRSGTRVIASILLGRLRVRLRGLRFRQRKPREISQRELARVDASWSIACSLGVIDFMRGADFQNDHLLLALDAGEPKRILRALTLEMSYAATPGRGSDERKAQLLKMSEELASTVDDPITRGLVRVSRGVAAYLSGGFSEALVECQAGLSDLRRYSGTVWESVTAQRFVVASLFHLGRVAELAELVPPLLAEAEVKGNLYASTFFRSTYSNAAWLRADEVDGAREQLRVARTQWLASGTQLAHCWMLLGECQLAFYTGETGPFWDTVETEWARMRAAQFLRIGMVKVQLLHLRSAVALRRAHERLGAGHRSEAKVLFREAQHWAERLDKQPLTFAKPFAQLLLSGVDLSVGSAEAARRRLSQCIVGFDEQHMMLYAAAARLRLAQLVGGDDGSRLRAEGRAVFEAQGITNVPRWTETLAPTAAPTSLLQGAGQPLSLRQSNN